MITPRIALVAYEDRNPYFIFVAVPNERGRYIRTDASVAVAECPVCGAQIGEPCLSHRFGHPRAKYCGTTHFARRVATPRGSRPGDVIERVEPPRVVTDTEMEPSA